MLYQLSYAHHNLVCGNGPPERTRTSDLRIRSPLLYPAELQAEVSSVGYWSGREDLNLRPPAPKAGALPGCATPRLGVHSLFAKISHPKAGSEYRFRRRKVSMAASCSSFEFLVLSFELNPHTPVA